MKNNKKRYDKNHTQCFPGMVGMNVALINQGRPRQSSMSNVFDPIELLIPMEP